MFRTEDVIYESTMAKNLVIVESPAKAKTINKYLGKDYLVKELVNVRRIVRRKQLENRLLKARQSLWNEGKLVRQGLLLLLISSLAKRRRQ